MVAVLIILIFVFMNPTGKNNASYKEWKGIRAPWIGSKNIWYLFYQLDSYISMTPLFVLILQRGRIFSFYFTKSQFS